MSSLALLILGTFLASTHSQSSFSETIDVANEYETKNYTVNVKSTVDSATDEQLDISITFTGGRCWRPHFSLSYEEIDFDQVEEYFLIYYPSVTTDSSNIIANCSGHYFQSCGVFSSCLSDYDLAPGSAFFDDGETISIYVVKSAAVGAYCSGYSMNLNLTISCSSEHYHEWHTMSSTNDNLPLPLYAHIAAYYNNWMAVIGGIESTVDGNPSSSIYVRRLLPYGNTNATGGHLAFSRTTAWSSSWLSLPDAVYSNNNHSLLCEGQCSTQNGQFLYIYGAFNSFGDSGAGVLLIYDVGSAVLAAPSYDVQSPLALSHACVTNNGTHLFVVGGYDGKSTTPWHNVQTYDMVNGGGWNANFASLYEPRIDAGCVVLNDVLYVIGGWTRYLSEVTSSIEMVDLSTMQSTLSDVALMAGRVGHKLVKDDLDRIWVIGGRTEDSYAVPNVKIFDTKNQSLSSMNNPVKYASTLSGGFDQSAVWFDETNQIMFASGGYNGSAVTNAVQYLATGVIGTDAFPTPPPTTPPVPTPYPTPIGHVIGWNQTYDMSAYTAADSVSFTQYVRSTEDLRTDDSFFYVHFKFINGMCNNASLSFQFEEVDFHESAIEYIELFYPVYPSDLVAHCTGNLDSNCGQWLTCLSRYDLEQPALDASDNSYNYLVSVIKSADINQFCTYSINANVTINCGPAPPPTPLPTQTPTVEPTPVQPENHNISQTFDLTGYTWNDTVSFTIPVQSTVDNSLDSLFFVDFEFINGKCNSPSLSFVFEEIDFASSNEFIDIYYPSYPGGYLSHCSGTHDSYCDTFLTCVDKLPLTYNLTDSVSVTLLKSAEVNRFCTYSINANVTITCGPTTHAPTPAPTVGDNLNISRAFDLTGVSENDSVSFTIPVQSTIDNYRDSIFTVEFDFMNGECFNPMLSFEFEEIDFADSWEFMSVYYPEYPSGFITQCTGSHDANCGTTLHCLDRYVLPMANGSSVDSLTVYVLKSADINKFCEFSVNANVTIFCGPPTPTYAPTAAPTLEPTPAPTPDAKAFSQTFDLSTADPTKLMNHYEINIHSTTDKYIDEILNVTFKFINGQCLNPYLSVKFEEIDFAQTDEYLEIRYPTDSEYHAIERCYGDQDSNCGHWESCLTFYDLALFNLSTIESEITLYILKSAQINAFCTYSINANITITCIQPIYANITCPPTSSPTTITTSLPTSTTITTTNGPTPAPTDELTVSPSGKPTSSPTSTTATSLPTSTTVWTTGTTTNRPSAAPSDSDAPTTSSRPTATTTGCGDASNAAGSDGSSQDKLMQYLPWILFAVSAFFNLLLLVALSKQIRYRKDAEIRQRMNLVDDSTQMVTMQHRAGYNNQGDFQEVTSDASVDYVTMAASN